MPDLNDVLPVVMLVLSNVFGVNAPGEKLTLNHACGFALIFAGAWLAFRGPF